MYITTCSENYVTSMVTMSSSSKEQNHALLNELNNRLITLDQCYILLDKEQVVARVIVYADLGYLGYFTVEHLQQADIDNFLKDILQQLDRTIEWNIDLYDDKVHYDLIYHALQTFFDLEIHRESYTTLTSDRDVSDYQFINAQAMEKEDILQLMMRADASTLDVILQRDQQQLGEKEAMLIMMNQCLSGKDDFFQVLCINKTPVGFVSIRQLLDDIGGITYIGVDPLYQGHHYSTILLNQALKIAHCNGINKLIGDIDKHNYAMRDNLLRSGFSFDCKQNIFILLCK